MTSLSKHIKLHTLTKSPDLRSQWIEPVEVHCTLGCEDDVTDHTRKQNSEKTLEKVTKPADHVSIHTDIVCGMRYIHPLQLIPFLRDSGT